MQCGNGGITNVYACGMQSVVLKCCQNKENEIWMEDRVLSIRTSIKTDKTKNKTESDTYMNVWLP